MTSEILSTMRSRLTMAQAAYSESRESELDDLRFKAGSPDNQWQWPADVLSTRGALQGQTVNARPILTINVLPQHVLQVTNDQRQNRPSIKVIPVDDGADVKVANVLEGMMRHIEYISDADVAYDTACDNQVTYGEGYIRILTDYCDDDSFDQDIRIGRIRNSFSVYMDPTIQDPAGSDAEWCLITQPMLKDEYEREWPDAQPVSALLSAGVGDQSMAAWLSEEMVTVAEYFYCEYKSAKLYLYADGRTAFEGENLAKVKKMMGEEPIKTRDAQKKTVKWLKSNGYEILEEGTWAGKWIPIVRVVGNEFEIDGKIYVSGIVRNAKDGQRMINYWTSQEAEMLALAPKAPFIGYGGQFEGYEPQWKTANTQNWPYLEVNPDVTDAAGSPLPLPMRAPPPLPQAGLFQAKMGAHDDVKITTGQYDASLGMMSNEKSGKAIIARERQSDTGTYHYVDNLARAIRHIGRQIIDLIPKIYDTARIARIIGLDDKAEMIKTNPAQEQAVKEIRDPSTNAIIERIYNLGVGKYDVMATTGPSYMTKRQETAEQLAQLLQGNPEMWAVFGDIAAGSLDFADNEEISERIKRWISKINPEVLSDSEEDPRLAAAEQQNQALSEHLQQAMKLLEGVQQSQEQQKLDQDQQRVELEAWGKKTDEYQAETQRLAAIFGAFNQAEQADLARQTIEDTRETEGAE